MARQVRPAVTGNQDQDRFNREVSAALQVTGSGDGATGPRGPTGPAGPAGSAGPAGATGADGAVLETLYEVDFKTLGTISLAMNSTTTVDGHTWTGVTQNTGNISLFEVNATDGMVIENSSSLGIPAIWVALQDLAPGLNLFTDEVYVWFRIDSANLSADTERQNVMILNGAAFTTASLTPQYWWTGAGRYRNATNVRMRVYYNSTGGQFVDTQAFEYTDSDASTDDVYMVHIKSFQQFNWFSGVWSGGWPDRSALRMRGELYMSLAAAYANLPTMSTVACGIKLSGTSNTMKLLNLMVQRK